ncbi:MAG: hypothetical protein ABFS02_10360, partial [Pseudomonadota bacterium]
MKLILILVSCLALAGCASFGKGVAEAFLEKQGSEDTRVCQVWGKSFDGIEPALSNRNGKMKVLMVHGVGHHIPGYSTQFLEKLAHEMGLDVMQRNRKELALTDPDDTSKDLGTLRVERLLNEAGTKELLFYELTWSAITEPDKKILAYDNSGSYSYRRAGVNDMLKKFSNDTGPDPMIYLGNKRDDILASFRQSFCWMIAADWDGLPSGANQGCYPVTEEALRHLSDDSFAVVSHSLGSRITIDGLQNLAQRVDDEAITKLTSSTGSRFIDEFRKKQLPLYMLSNQLPLLQLGRALPKVTGQSEAYCIPGGSHYDARTLAKTSLIAFSDPNDLLSYAIPDGFASDYLDSRLCIEVTNIIINVANVMDLFGVGEVANPLTAHVGYDSDDRVVALIAKGIGNPNIAPLVKERCEWTRLVD